MEELPRYATQTSPALKPEECYPKVGTHTWQEFPALAVELGGYGDITAIDPYTGRRFWVGRVRGEEGLEHMSPYMMLSMLVIAMQEAQFLG